MAALAAASKWIEWKAPQRGVRLKDNEGVL